MNLLAPWDSPVVWRATAGLWIRTQSGVDPVDPQRTREQLTRILDRKEFSYDKSLVERFFEWLGKLIGRILPDLNPQPVAPPSGPGFVTYLVVAMLVIGAIVLLFFAVRELLRRGKRVKKTKADSDTEVKIKPNQPRDQWLDESLELENAGDWKGAILVRYRHLVTELQDRDLVEAAPGDTPTEIRVELGELMPESVDLMGEANEIFADPWYGDRATGQTQAERLSLLTEQILTQPVSSPASSEQGDR